jgi:hypothetical protein
MSSWFCEITEGSTDILDSDGALTSKANLSVFNLSQARKHFTNFIF